jgi:hypothetical protein
MMSLYVGLVSEIDCNTALRFSFLFVSFATPVVAS